MGRDRGRRPVGEAGRGVTTDVVLAPRVRTVHSYATGQHMPRGYVAPDGRWRCHDCGQALRTYVTDHGVRRLRHKSRKAA